MKKYIVLLLILLSFTVLAADKLLQSTDFSYTGCFKIDIDNGNYSTGRGLAYNSTNNSLYVVGQYGSGRVGEVNIPTLYTGTSEGSIPTATIRQNFVDVTNGSIQLFGSGGSYCDASGAEFRGLLVYNGYLYGAATGRYDTAPICSYLSHFKTNLTLTTGAFDGYYGLLCSATGWTPRMTAGGMCKIPAAYQTQLGGKVITGSYPDSISTQGPNGPSIASFDPEALGTKNTSTSSLRGAATLLIGYPEGYSLNYFDYDNANTYHTRCDHVTGGMIAANSRTVFFIGQHGSRSAYSGGDACDPYYTGSYVWMYDIGNADGTNTTGNDTAEDGYTSGTKHNNITAVKLGIIHPYNILPYAMFIMTTPWDTSPSEWNAVYAYTIDQATNKVYASRNRGGSGAIIEVYSIDSGPSTPTSVPTIGVGGFRTW